MPIPGDGVGRGDVGLVLVIQIAGVGAARGGVNLTALANEETAWSR